MIYDLTKDLDRKKFMTRVNAFWEKGARVELTDKRPRSLNQNAYLHVILGALAMETGNSLEYIKQEVFKKRCNPDIFLVEKDDPMLGHVEVLRSSRNVTVNEMSTAIDRYRKWCSEHGVYIPSAGEESLLADLERQMSQQAQWL